MCKKIDKSMKSGNLSREDDYPSQKDLAKTFIRNLAVQNHFVLLMLILLLMLLMCQGWGHAQMVQGWMNKLSLAHSEKNKKPNS